jgi:hypothetical protein
MSSTTGHIPQAPISHDPTISADYIDTSCGNARNSAAGSNTTSFTTTHNMGTMEETSAATVHPSSNNPSNPTYNNS